MATLKLNIGRKKIYRFFFVAFFLFTGIIYNGKLDAQYFGRNKPGYKSFKFDVVRTPHFEIYHYLKNDSLIDALSRWSEKWYKIHQYVFRDTFKTRNPIIFYNSHAIGIKFI
jgi:hypothetical protein